MRRKFHKVDNRHLALMLGQLSHNFSVRIGLPSRVDMLIMGKKTCLFAKSAASVDLARHASPIRAIERVLLYAKKGISMLQVS